MKCPRCGADNADRAAWCYLCEYPFAPDAGAVEPPAPDEAIQARYVPTGAVPPAQQAAPPSPVGEVSYQPPPPGAYAPGYRPPPAAGKGPVTARVVVMALVLVLLVALGVGAYFLLRSEYYSIEVPTPPGFEPASDDLVDELKEAVESSSDTEDVEVDYVFTDASESNFIFVARRDIPVTLSTDAPPSGDPEAVEEWYYENQDEWIEELRAEIAMSGIISSEVALYEVERLATGDATLHMAMTASGFNTPTLYIDILWIIKGDTAFFILVEGLNSNPKTIDFLKENITFKE
ncbi:MAG: hypothetical protein AB1384_08955 [Actinomycetota bacterium]